MLYELIVRLDYNKKCRKGYIWCTDGTFIHPSDFKSSNKTAYGYALTSNKVARLKRTKSFDGYWSRLESYCTRCRNAGKYGYFPNKDELSLLYSSVMYGKMDLDLTTSGLYRECNYRMAFDSTSDPNWYLIFSSDEYNSSYAYYVDSEGIVSYCLKSTTGFAIPFYDFS